MSPRYLLPALILASLAVAPAQATPFTCNTPQCMLPTTASEVAGTLRGNTATRFSVGLQWNFGAEQPELVAAVRRAETTPHQQVYGVQADLAMPVSLSQPLQWPTLRLLGVAGGDDDAGTLMHVHEGVAAVLDAAHDGAADDQPHHCHHQGHGAGVGGGVARSAECLIGRLQRGGQRHAAGDGRGGLFDFVHSLCGLGALG
jgi:hypothetical protein